MQKKKVPTPTIKTESIKQLRMVSVRGLRMDICPKVGFGDSGNININIDSIDGESESINSFMNVLSKICN